MTTALTSGRKSPSNCFGRRARRTEVAAQKLSSTREAVSDNERLLAAEVRMRFADALATWRNLEFVDQLLQANREFLKLTEDRVREGAIPVLDADEVRVEVNRIESLRIDYQAKAEIAMLALKEAAGFQPEEELRLKGSLEQAPLSPDKAQLLELAVSHRPDLAAQRANESMATAGLRQLQAEAKPDASFPPVMNVPTADSHSPRSMQPETFSPSAKPSTMRPSGFRWTLPIFNRNQGSIVAAKADIDSARNQVAAVDLTLRHEVTQSLVRYQASQERVTLYRRGVRDQAAQNLDVVRQTYGYGRVPLLDAIAEQRRYIDIETGYTDILFDAYASRIALEKAVGTSLP